MPEDVVASRHRRTVPAIAAALVLTLLAALTTVVLLRERDQRLDTRARVRLDGAVFAVKAVGVATSHRVAVVLSLSSGVDARLVDATVVGEGWVATHDKAVGLARAVDCAGPPPLPEAAAAVVELRGQRRSVDLLADPAVFDVVRSTGREACGDIDAGRALRVRTTPASRTVKQVSFTLTLTNRSAHPVTLRGFSVVNTRLATSRPLPIVLAPRASRALRVVLTPAGCPKGAITEAVVRVALDGTGGRAGTTTTVPKLAALLEVLRKERCA